MRSQFGFTLLEMIVVVAIIAILAGVGGAPVMAWNCKRHVQRDFGDIVGVYADVRSQALGSNSSLMLVATALSGGGYRYSWGLSNRACTTTPSAWLGTADFPQANFAETVTPTCFHADQTATGSGFTLSKTCGGNVLEYRATIYGASGYLLKERKMGDAAWEEL